MNLKSYQGKLGIQVGRCQCLTHVLLNSETFFNRVLLEFFTSVYEACYSYKLHQLDRSRKHRSKLRNHLGITSILLYSTALRPLVSRPFFFIPWPCAHWYHVHSSLFHGPRSLVSNASSTIRLHSH